MAQWPARVGGAAEWTVDLPDQGRRLGGVVGSGDGDRPGRMVDPAGGKMMLEEYADRWLSGRTDLRPRTRELYRHLLDHYVLSDLGKVPLAALPSSTVRSWHAKVLAARPGTAPKAYRLLASIYRTAVDDELVLRSPCRLRGAGAERAAERPTIPLPVVEALADAAGPYRVMVLLAAWCKLRFGELAALTGADVDLLHRTVTVRNTVTETGDGKRALGPPKTDAGRWPSRRTCSTTSGRTGAPR